MELASAPLNSYYAVSPVPPASRKLSLSLPVFRASVPRISSPFLAFKATGFLFPCEKVRSHSSFLAAGVGNTTAVTDESAQEHMPLGKKLDPEAEDGAVKENDEDLKDRNVAGEQLDDHKMLRICDKLIEVFMVDKPTATDWRRLLTFSKEWNNIRPHFYKRCQDRADIESDHGKKHQLLRLARKLKEVDEDIQRHNELLDAIRKSPSEVGQIVARRRKDFTKEFFVHLHTVAESYYDNPTEQTAVTKLRNTCLAAVEAYDTATENIEALNAAELKLQDIINSPSVDAACRKIDNLAEKNQLDSALVLMITKAWSAAKESNMMKDEVKDVLFHLYKTARGNLQRLMPKEIRILKYLLTIEDPEERMSALKDAFTPGEELEGQDIDSLYTTPEQLHTWITTVVDAYHFSREGTLIREARDLMNPKLVQKMEQLKKTIQDHFIVQQEEVMEDTTWYMVFVMQNGTKSQTY
ncbi:hypothetical protein Salat_1146000 [Sesamum alatum]|uniref:Uncharacterized protein n=1 Tax=Sesamum alatum TaxID=300844 RepID=A0AAE2CNK4_9LAMI|nr:hypothetical protein Salat_1146000 [Sesamum alatum]